MKQYILAIDQGTTNTKALLFSLGGNVCACATRPLECIYPKPQHVEQRIGELYESVIGAAGEVLSTSAVASCDIIACGITNQRETFVLWDEHGRALSNAIVWSCKRSVGICESLRARQVEALIAEKTGLRIDPYFSATKLMHLVQEDGDLAQRIRDGAVYFGTIDTYLLYRLTHGAVYATDYTNASRTLFFNSQTLAWDQELLALFGLQNLRLPEAHPCAHRFGATDFEGTLPSRVPIAGMIGDSHAALLGHGSCADANAASAKVTNAKVTMGTGSSIMLSTGTEHPSDRKRLLSVVCFATERATYYGLEGIIVNFGSIIRWMKEQAKLFATFDEAEAIVARHSSDGVVCVPAFAGLGAPYWNSSAKAAIHGITLNTSRNNIIRAAYEAMVFQIRRIVDAVQQEHTVSLQSLQLDGGMVANRTVVQMLADAVCVPVHVPSVAYFSAWGAALCAGMGMNIWQEDAMPRLQCDVRRYEHTDNHALLGAYEQWKRVMDTYKTAL